MYVALNEMSQANHIPAWAASPEEFERTLEVLVSTARENGVQLDRSWTFRHDEPEYDDVMVEITSLAPRPELADPTPNQPSVSKNTTTADFEVALNELLMKGQEAGMAFDRSWTFRDSNPESNDTMVEISRLAKPSC
ncbi:hypothetical protein NKF25_23785 [Haladaptatus sp. AB643]|uniref:hypothetical protein n=2 Tax=unclassified Haladaptatus TaxID=2622732 RepID=UPI00209BFB15|nr:hypothetical protein [Haladaptatus sp. AB618]MCO8247086.1 hypothetical protein [Haladaptatus sp. AB643]